MILGGDEFGRSQAGSNNAYCQDSPISWVDWSLLNENRDILEFVQACTALRREEQALRISRFPDESLEEKDPWIWFSESGNRLTEGEWADPERRSFGILVDSSAGDHTTWLVMLFNAGGEEAKFQPPVELGQNVRTMERVISSALDDHEPLVAPAGSFSVYRVKAT